MPAMTHPCHVEYETLDPADEHDQLMEDTFDMIEEDDVDYDEQFRFRQQLKANKAFRRESRAR